LLVRSWYVRKWLATRMMGRSGMDVNVSYVKRSRPVGQEDFAIG
jgi:hypothetical protein